MKKLQYADWWASAKCEDYRWSWLTRAVPDLKDMPAAVPQRGHWYAYLERCILPSLPSTSAWLSLCCGRGSLERSFAAQNAFSSCLAVDVSEKQLRIAKRLARGITNVRYEQRDLNTTVFPEDAFDLVILQGGAHHIADLDHLFSQVSRCLRPGKYFVLHEYVGPIRWQFTQRQVQMTNGAMAMIPRQYRPSANPHLYYRLAPYNLSGDSMQRRIAKIVYYAMEQRLKFNRPGPDDHLFSMQPLERILKRDPSESVSGSNILPSLERYFEIVHYMPIGGTVISLVQNFDWEFDMHSSEFVALVDALLQYERDLLDANTLSSDYAAITVCNRK